MRASIKYFAQGFFGLAAAYTIPLLIAHFYFDMAGVELCYVLIGVQAFISAFAAIAQIHRHGNALKWVVYAFLSVGLNAALPYALVWAFSVQTAIIAYVIAGAAHAGKACIEYERYNRFIESLKSVSYEVSTEV